MAPLLASTLRGAAVCAVALAALGRPAAGEMPTPVPTPMSTAAPSPTPSLAPYQPGLSAHAHGMITLVGQNKTVTASVDLAMAERPNLIRVDILSVKSDAMPLPPIMLTAVFDRRVNTVTVWSPLTKRYHVQTFLPQPTPTVNPKATPPPMVRPTSLLSMLDVLAITIKMTGHTITAGVPTTGLSFDLQVAKKGEAAPTHVVATIQIVDNSVMFPMTIDASIEPGNSPQRASLAYAVDELTRGLPPLSRFTVPHGYMPTDSIGGVILHVH
jgi:hypothetical protein